MYRRILLACCLLNLSAAAQQPQMVDTEFLTVAIDEAVDGLFYFDGKAAQPFEANVTGLSQPMSYIGPRRFVVRTTAAEFSLKPPLPAPVASVDFPMNCKRVLVICVKSANTPLRMVAYDISTTDRAGDYRFFNFSRKPLSLILGDKRVALEPGKDTLLSDASWRDAVLDLPIKLAAVDNNKAKPIYSSIWGHRPGRRNFIFMFDGQHPSKPITFCRFFDIPGATRVAAP